LQLTYHTDYALRMLIYLVARPGQTVSTREIAAFYGVSVHHLVKVAKSLTQAGWLVGTRGIGGGIRMADHTPDTSVGEIIRHTESTDLVECFNPLTNTCPINGSCDLKPMLYQARQAFFTVLDAYKVKDLARQGMTDRPELVPPASQ
jgi:Rrf2 family nitric oxide-sensitive transcriptional repressor